jgi:hypothetical protein
MRHPSFILEGVYYHQQYRKCGKVNCTVCQDGPGHGPYWYGLDKATQKKRYVGKNLPDHIMAAANALDRMRKEINRKRLDLLAQAAALERLSNNDTLTEEDRTIIAVLGFGECLVSKFNQFFTQDANNYLVPEHNRNTVQDDNFLKLLVDRIRQIAVPEIFGGAMGVQNSHKLALDYAVSERKYALQLVAYVRGRISDVYISREIAARTQIAIPTPAILSGVVDTLALRLLNSLRTQLNQFAKFSFLDVGEEAHAGLKRIVIE